MRHYNWAWWRKINIIQRVVQDIERIMPSNAGGQPLTEEGWTPMGETYYGKRRFPLYALSSQALSCSPFPIHWKQTLPSCPPKRESIPTCTNHRNWVLCSYQNPSVELGKLKIFFFFVKFDFFCVKFDFFVCVCEVCSQLLVITDSSTTFPPQSLLHWEEKQRQWKVHKYTRWKEIPFAPLLRPDGSLTYLCI